MKAPRASSHSMPSAHSLSMSNRIPTAPASSACSRCDAQVQFDPRLAALRLTSAAILHIAAARPASSGGHCRRAALHRARANWLTRHRAARAKHSRRALGFSFALSFPRPVPGSGFPGSFTPQYSPASVMLAASSAAASARTL
eukprot:7387399-Prymnesium_polylepis.1